MVGLRGMRNAFKPAVVKGKPTPRGSAGFDNPRENVDPHIKTQVVSSREGSVEKVPVNGNDICNKTYVDAAGFVDTFEFLVGNALQPEQHCR